MRLSILFCIAYGFTSAASVSHNFTPQRSCSLILVGLPQSGTVFIGQHPIWEFLLIFNILECCLVTVVEHYFVVHKIFKVLFGKGIFFEIKVESTNWLSCWLIIREMKLLQVRVGQGLLYGNSILWVVCQHLLQKVNCLWICSLEELIKVFSFTLW